MAAPSLGVLRGLSRWQNMFTCRSPSVSCISPSADRHQSVRFYAAPKKKVKKEEAVPEKVEKVKRVIDNTNRHKPFGLTAWAPVDDVYVTRFYPKPVFNINVAIEMLKSFRKLDFTPENVPLYINLRLDMKLEKKKKIDPFVSTIKIPHTFREDNRVVFFTADPDNARIAIEHGASVAGGKELVQKILDDEITADFYLAEPAITDQLVPLKNKLRKKFPKSKRGTVGKNIPEMLALFRTGHEYKVEDIYVNTEVATLDMPTEHILENIRAIVKNVASHKPEKFGPFINRAIIASRSSEGLHVKLEDILPQETNE